MKDQGPDVGARRRFRRSPDAEAERAVARLESAVVAAGAELTASRRRATELEMALEAARDAAGAHAGRRAELEIELEQSRAEVRRLRSRLDA